MLRGFENAFNEMMSQRNSEIGSELIIKNDKYINAKDREKKLFNQIKALLPDEHKKTLNEFVDLQGELEVITEDIIYNQGLKDGFELKQMLALVV